MIIKIKNWEKFNPRADKANFTWFRFQNNFFQNTFSWSANDQRLFIYMCCLASEKNGGEFEYNIELCSALLKIKKAELLNSQRNLEKFDVLRTPAGVQETPMDSHRPATNERTNERTYVPSVPECNALQIENLAELWNQNCGALPKVVSVTEARRKKAIRLLEQKPDSEYWREIITAIAASDFCTGGGSTGWRADFDWLLKPDTHVRVSEGKYGVSKKVLVIQTAPAEY